MRFMRSRAMMVTVAVIASITLVGTLAIGLL